MVFPSRIRVCAYAAALGLASMAGAADILSTSGFTECGNGPQDVTVSDFQLSFDRSTKELDFAVAGESKMSQNVTAQINVTALGNQVYTRTFNPCDYNIQQLCPIPAGPFHAKGNITIPDEYVKQIPSIAFSIPDLDGAATLSLISDGNTVSCLQSSIQNGKSTEQKSVTYVTLGVAGAALIMTGVASLGSLGAAGAGSGGPNSGSAQAPNLADILQWFQFVAFSGMYSVDYPPVYRNFCKNFAWSTGLVSWGAMQTTIDTFRAKTGGNLTENNYEFVKNATLIFTQPSTIQKRQIDFGLDDGGLSNTTIGTTVGENHYVRGIEAFVEALFIPSANTFMTVLLIFMIILSSVAVGMLLIKFILELWATCSHLSKRFESIRKNYWRILSTTIVRIVLIVYGTWAVYCLYQFRTGDSWAASLLAGVTLAIFTAVLAFFTIRIFYLAAKAKKLDGGVDELYEHKPWMRKYGFFYDQFKSRLWWFFVPILLVSLLRAFLLVFGAGNGMVQAIGILAVEGIFLILLFWRRPYDGRGANVINAMIAVVRVLSIICILVFVEQLGISRTTQTITGVVLIAIQSTLTVVLALLIIISAIISCCHKRKPTQPQFKKVPAAAADDDLAALGIPSGENSEMYSYPTTKKGYVRTATTEVPFNRETHRASTVFKDPFMANPTPVYEEYSSTYRGSRPASVSTRHTSLGHGRVDSIGHESGFQYRPIGSPPPIAGGQRQSYPMH